MKRFGSIAAVLLVFILSAFAFVKIYDKGKDQKPLRFADIPPETVDWFENIGKGLGDILSSFNPIPRPTPWDNKGDFGQDPESGLQTLEDDLFIFYFPEKLKKQAILCQKFAHKAIPRLEDIIGKYYYPDDMNGRKVPIYLMPDQESFNDLMVQFGGHRDDYDSVGGITIQEVSNNGYFLRAIALNGRYAFSSEAKTRHILWHEMTHYCYFASLDYSRNVSIPMWNYEGIAEYTSQPGERPSFIQGRIDMMRNDCNLTALIFPYVFEVYEGGHSIYCHMEDRYKVDGIKAFLKTLYKKGMITSFEQNFSTTVPEFEADWKANLDKFKM